MGSVCCKPKEREYPSSPRVTLGKVLTRWTHHIYPSAGNPLKTPATNHNNNNISVSMENQEAKPGAVSGKKEVWFIEPEDEEPPRPPPRKNRKRRLSKSRRGVHFGNLPPEDDTSPGTESPEEHEEHEGDEEDGNLGKVPSPSRSSQDSLSDGEIPKSRLPELLRRDTFCDALDFRLYSLKRIPGRRSSSLDALYWQEEDEEAYAERQDDQGMTRSAEHLPQARADWLKGLLGAHREESKIEEHPIPKSDKTLTEEPEEQENAPIEEVPLQEEHKEDKKEENNNSLTTKKPVLILDPAELTLTLEKIKSTHITTKEEHYHCVYTSQQTTATLKPVNDRDSPSRKSSMTESLQEFESSLIEMLKAQPTTDTEEEHPHADKHPKKDIITSTNF